MPQSLLLTGATGLLGRYLLRDLLAAGRRVGVLIRGDHQRSAAERLDELLAFASESLGHQLPCPTLLEGDLRAPGLGLGTAERSWLGREAETVIHAAAYVAYHPAPEGEPWETNVNGTYRLLDLCRSLGVTEVHHVSTAFLCGDRRGTVYEHELDIGEGSGNAYEQSKFAAEQSLHDFAGIRATIYRPSIIVGDSRTGYTSTYHHFYRFLELAVRLFGRTGVSPVGPKARARRLTLRLPLSGNERQNVVPVDWVSRALIELVGQPRWHGQTYHLVNPRSVPIREATAITEELLQFEGIQWVGEKGLPDPTSVEQMVLEQFQDYWSYLRNDVTFDCRNTLEALPKLPPPAFDRELVARLLHFAQNDGWGRERAHSSAERGTELAHFLEQILPARMRRSRLAEALPPGLVFALDVAGADGGRWTCRCGDRTLNVRRGATVEAIATYRMDAAILDNLIHGRQTAQQAFLEGHIHIDGDMEKALKLAMLIEAFLAEIAERPPQSREELHAAA
ncbi:MAG: SDR family oxidoreductase [Gemmataceae bacterium]